MRLFRAFGPRWVRFSRAQLPDDDALSEARLTVLGTLAERGLLPMTGLAGATCTTKRNITQLVDGLEAEGLVRRRPHPTDRRSFLIELTDAGEARAPRLREAHELGAATLFEKALSKGEQETLAAIIRKLIDALDEEGYTTAASED